MQTLSSIHARRRPASLAALAALAGLLLANAAAAQPSECDSIAAIPIRWNIDYAKDIQAIFSTRCANCHVDHAGSPSADLDLDPKWSYENLVGAPSWTGGTLVVPGNPAASVLYQKINCDVPVFGARMPRDRPALPLAEQALIHDWIMLGAQRITDTLFGNGFEPRP